MNSFLKGFLSIFDWMHPKTMKEQLEDLDQNLETLYAKMNWGKYQNPLKHKSYNECFVPYTHYVEEMDCIKVYFINVDCYVQPINDSMDLHLEFGTNNIVGVTIRNTKKLIKEKYLPSSQN